MKKHFLISFSFLLVIAFIMAGCQKNSNVVSPQDNSAANSLSKKGAEKVVMRHNGHLISVSINAMNAHFALGDQQVVTSADLATDFNDVAASPYKWFFYNDETDQIDNSLGSFVTGPGIPPYGNGSAQISVSGTQRRNLATYQFSGTPLADINVLAFSTYNPSVGNGGSANRSGYLNFNVDFDGSDTWQHRLIFVPVDNGTVIQNQWQEWDCINGGNALWRFSGSVWPGTSTPGTTTKTWSQILSEYPGVRVRVTDSWLGIRVGEPYANGYTENIDGFKFGTTFTKTFDFEN